MKNNASLDQGNRSLLGQERRDLLQPIQRHSSDDLVRLQATALATVANGVLITDNQGIIIWVNSGFTSLTGYLPAEVIGKNPRLLKSGRHGPSFYHDLWTTILSGRTWRGEFTNRRKDGTPYHDEHTITPVSTDGKITHFVTIMQDISERKRAQEEIIRLNEMLERRVHERTAELEAANRELEAFSYSVSHDLRTPLRAIRGFTQIVSEDHSERLDEEGKRLLSTVCSEAQRMDQLINDLLAFSRLAGQRLKTSRVDMNVLADTAFAGLTRQTTSTPRFERKQLPEAPGDKSMLMQVFANLLGNAIKFSRRCLDPVIEVGGWQTATECGYYVKDNGVGFDDKFRHKLFSVFQRLHGDDEFEGTGVGLALVDRIIRRHGGKVWAEGKLGSGATFFFSLPSAPELSEEKPDQTQSWPCANEPK